MNFIPLSICVLLGLVTVLGLVPVIRRSSRAFGVALPTRVFHHTHKTPVSRLGGIALAVAFTVVAAVAFIWFPAQDAARTRTHLVVVFSALAMFLLGLWDDLRPIGARKKLIGQIIIAVAVC